MHANVRARPWPHGRTNHRRDPAGTCRVADAQLESIGRGPTGSSGSGGRKLHGGGGAAMSAQVQHAEPGFFKKYLWSTDHKMIAMQYLFTGMAMAVIGGYLAYVFRMQQGFPNQDVPGFG